MSLLDKVVIAAPCPMSWENMEGNDRVRHCQGCAKNVYNISDMSTAEAEQFLLANGTDACIRLFRRQDGTLINDNCPVGLRNLRNKCKAVVRAIAAAVASLIAFIPAVNAQGSDKKIIRMGKPATHWSPVSVQPTGGGPTHANGGFSMAPVVLPPHETLGGDSVAPARPAGPKKTVVIGAEECSSPKTVPAVMPAPKNGDMSAFNLYTTAKQSESDGKLMVAHTQYINALDTAKKQKHSDPKMISLMLADLNRLRTKMGFPVLKSENDIDSIKMLY